MLLGFDVSHHNKESLVRKAIEDNSKQVNFLIIKATEGRTWRDIEMHSFQRLASSYGLLYGFYHYARPDNGNTPISEATNFVTNIKKYIGHCMLILDWEGAALTKKYNNWCYQWMLQVEDMTGIKPLIYTNKTGLGIIPAKNLTANNNGLWIADWNDEQRPSTTGLWNCWALWQCVSGEHSKTGLDENLFNGTRSQFRKYCIPNLKDEIDVGYCDCGCKYCCKEGE